MLRFILPQDAWLILRSAALSKFLNRIGDCEPDFKSAPVSRHCSAFTGTTMQARRKPFRVETVGRGTARANAHAHGSHHTHHDEIITELRALRALIKPSEQVTAQMVDGYK